jgi:hypothetical protein
MAHLTSPASMDPFAPLRRPARQGTHGDHQCRFGGGLGQFEFPGRGVVIDADADAAGVRPGGPTEANPIRRKRT